MEDVRALPASFPSVLSQNVYLEHEGLRAIESYKRGCIYTFIEEQ